MVNSKMEAALNEQVNSELSSAYLYLSMSYDMDSKGYEGMACWFALQAKEEFEHATRIMKFIGETGGKVKLEPIGKVRQEWDSPKNAFEEVLATETNVTGKIHRLMDMAVELKDYATQNMLSWFVGEQVEEEDSARKILEKLKKVEDSPAAMCALDAQLGKR
ncbi:MAG: ferritin [Rikenellaceae bacterium]|nr:ferritin [Rikenellaceae bacterium]MCL2693326.1 ferritin [Rikenellaceae bacterium]